MVKGKTKSGIKYQIDERIKDDARVLFILTKLQEVAKAEASAENVTKGGKLVFDLLALIFGSDDGIVAFMDEVARHNKGVCDTKVMIAEIMDIFEYTSSLSELFTTILVNLIKNVLTIVAVYSIMFFISWKLSLVMLGVVGIVFVVSFIFRKVVHKFFTGERKCISDMNAFLNENLSGMKIIQLFNQEKRKEKQFDVKNDKLRKMRYRILLAFGIYRPLISFIYFGSVAITFTFALQTIISAGEVVAFYLYLSKFFNPIQNIADQINGIQRAVTASERLFNLLDVQPEVPT